MMAAAEVLWCVKDNNLIRWDMLVLSVNKQTMQQVLRSLQPAVHVLVLLLAAALSDVQAISQQMR